jgi:hypothetical protein
MTRDWARVIFFGLWRNIIKMEDGSLFLAEGDKGRLSVEGQFPKHRIGLQSIF